MTVAHDSDERRIRAHNAGPSAAWSSGGAAYDEVSRGIQDAIEHAINRLEPSADKRVLDLAEHNSSHNSRAGHAGRLRSFLNTGRA